MAMRFAQASRAENPDMARALAMQTQIANELKGAEMQAEAQNKASMMSGGVDLAVAAPEGTFTDAWDTAMGSGGGGMSDFSALSPETLSTGFEGGVGGADVGAMLGDSAAVDYGLAESLSGEAIASGIGTDLAAAGTSQALTGEALAAGMAPEMAAASTAAGAGGGVTAALGSMGPMGWAALAAIGMGLFG